MCVPVGVTINVMKYYDQKANWERKALFRLHFHITVHQQRKTEQDLKQGRNLKAGADAEVMESAAY